MSDCIGTGAFDDGHICPECWAGKHRNCDTTAWCWTEDKPVPCVCTHNERGAP
jgi:hypothetical protein